MVNGVLFCTKSKWRETKTYQQRWTNCCWLVLFIKTDGQKLSLQLLQELCRMRKDFSAFPIQYAGHQLVMIMVGVISALIFSCGKATVGTSHSKKSHNDFHPCFTLYTSSLSTGTMDITRLHGGCESLVDTISKGGFTYRLMESMTSIWACYS